MTHDEMIALIKAHRDGKMIQYRSVDSKLDWIDKSPFNKTFDFKHTQYRIKPEQLSISDCWDKAMKTSSMSTDNVLVQFLKIAKENGHV